MNYPDPLFINRRAVSALTPERVENIRALGAAGYTLIPLNGKIPLEGWREVKKGQFSEANLKGNYGVALTETDLVVDIDPRNFTPGDNPVRRLIDLLKTPLDSFTVKTGGGGLHIYLRIPAGVLVKNSLKDFAGIEFKSVGRQVVAPGSIHPDSGKEYAVASGTPREIADAPTALLALIERTVVPFDEVGTGQYMNDAATQGRFADYLEFNAPTSGAFVVACRGRDMGLPPATTCELMLEIWNKRRTVRRTPEEMRAKVVHAYKYASGAVGSNHPQADFANAPPIPKEEELAWVTTRQGAVQKCFQNLITFLRFPKAGMAGVFAFNEFTGRIEFVRPAPWHKGRLPRYLGVGDDDLKMLKGHLAMRHGFEMNVGQIEEAVTNVAYHARFHPVRNWLNSLKWDGTPRLDFWLRDFLGVDDSEYSRACARKVLCAAVQRVFEPGCKFDHVLILEGAQDAGKSTAVEILGAPWNADAPVDPHNRDTVDLLQGRWIVELAEMEVVRKTDEEALKAFITRKTDLARLAYGRRTSEYPRQSIFIATKNPRDDGTYLKDPTGNRRWWPVRCDPRHGLGQVDFSGLKASRDQLFAEAVALMKSDRREKLYMETKELKDAAKGEAALRHAEHEWAERIGDWIEEQDRKPETRKEFITARDVYMGAMSGMDKQFDRKAVLGIAAALRNLGWEAKLVWCGKRPIRGYVREGYITRDLQNSVEQNKILDSLGSFA